MRLPPYGFMSSDFAARLGPLAPARWPAAVPFGAWLLAERDLLARHVWPWWDERAGAWAGAAAGGAEHLTRADLALMASISSRWN